MVALERDNYVLRTQLDTYLASNKSFEEFASQFGISDIYKDSNVKQLQQAIYLGLHFISGRNSFDAIDDYGYPWELKSLNVLNQKKEFTTCNPMTKAVLDRYKTCRFAFSLYENTTLTCIYVMNPWQLTPYFDKWKNQLMVSPQLNNPKITLTFVREHGYKVYDAHRSPHVVNPAQLLSFATDTNENAISKFVMQ